MAFRVRLDRQSAVGRRVRMVAGKDGGRHSDLRRPRRTDGSGSSLVNGLYFTVTTVMMGSWSDGLTPLTTVSGTATLFTARDPLFEMNA